MINSVKSSTAIVANLSKHAEERIAHFVKNLEQNGNTVDKIEISDEAKAALYQDALDYVNEATSGAAGKTDMPDIKNEVDPEKRRELVAFKIAMRIARGDNVPEADHRFLVEYDSKLYMAAMRARTIAENKNPKDYDSLAEALFALEAAEAEEAAEAAETELAEASAEISTENTEPSPEN